jgi:NAD(P)-dependent dehydrogenase (short-subunit alcohol dehydrogenase family)
VPLGRLAEPEDIADIVGFVVSHQARWITGQSVHAGRGRVLTNSRHGRDEPVSADQRELT